jgi:alpha-galactosidase
MKLIHNLIALTMLLGAHALGAEKKPLKVFILAGQSNREGPASIKTFNYIGDDPATAPLLKRMRGADAKPAVCATAWISYLTGIGGDNGEGTR